MAADGPWLLQLCNDRRGIWLTVAEGLRGVHVNGRNRCCNWPCCGRVTVSISMAKSCN